MRAYLLAAAVLTGRNSAFAQAECPTESSLRAALAHVEAARAELCGAGDSPECDRLAARATELTENVDACYGAPVDPAPHPLAPASSPESVVLPRDGQARHEPEPRLAFEVQAGVGQIVASMFSEPGGAIAIAVGAYVHPDAALVLRGNAVFAAGIYQNVLVDSFVGATLEYRIYSGLWAGGGVGYSRSSITSCDRDGAGTCGTGGVAFDMHAGYSFGAGGRGFEMSLDVIPALYDPVFSMSYYGSHGPTTVVELMAGFRR